jgi:hypothetical protein
MLDVMRARRLEAKRWLAVDVAGGRLGLLEAAARFRHLDRQQPPFAWAIFRRHYAGASDDERHCREVINWVRALARSRGEEDAGPGGRLEAGLRDLLKRGDCRLPEDPPPAGTLPPGPWSAGPRVCP